MKKFIIAIMMLSVLVLSVTAEAGFGSSGSRSSSSMSSTSSRPSSSLSSGRSIGMQRTTPSYQQPSYNRSYTTQTPSYQQPYTPNYQTNHVTVNRTYNGGSNGFGMGSLAMAAMGGYMLNGIMHNHDGSVYNGSGYSNGVPVQGGQYDQPPPQQYQQIPVPQTVQPQPIIITQQTDSSFLSTIFKFVLGLTIGAVLVIIIRRVFL